MESEKTLTERIVAITAQINKQFPELVKYIPEMTVTNPDEDDPEINKKILKEYHDSLLEMVKKYKANQAECEDKKDNV